MSFFALLIPVAAAFIWRSWLMRKLGNIDHLARDEVENNGAQNITQPSTPNNATQQELHSKSTSLSTNADQNFEEEIYERISKEMESNSLDKGIWTKAFAMAGGDDRKARATYINLRFAKLQKIELSSLAAEAAAKDAIDP